MLQPDCLIDHITVLGFDYICVSLGFAENPFESLERAARPRALECELMLGAVSRCAHHTSM